jgi:hypothetical protein
MRQVVSASIRFLCKQPFSSGLLRDCHTQKGWRTSVAESSNLRHAIALALMPLLACCHTYVKHCACNEIGTRKTDACYKEWNEKVYL